MRRKNSGVLVCKSHIKSLPKGRCRVDALSGGECIIAENNLQKKIFVGYFFNTTTLRHDENQTYLSGKNLQF